MDLLNGKIKPLYFKYLSAAFGSALISSIYGMVDMAMVGQYQGPDGTAALAVVAPVWNVIYSLGLLTGIGGSVIFSAWRGSSTCGDGGENQYFTAAVIGSVLLAVLAWLGLLFFERPLLTFFGADESLLALAQRYLVPIKYVFPFFLFNQMLAAFLRNDDDPGLATLGVLSGGIFNVFGDYFFVFPCDMGIYGAGLATAIGSVISFLVLMTHFLRRRNTLWLVRVERLPRKLWEITVSGFSSFFIDVAMGILTVLFNRQIMRYLGSDALAVYGPIINVSTFVQCCAYSVGQAVQPIISTNYGAGKGSRIRETLRLALYTTAAFALFWTALSFAAGTTAGATSRTSRTQPLYPGIHEPYAGDTGDRPGHHPGLRTVLPAAAPQYLLYLLLPVHHAATGGADSLGGAGTGHQRHFDPAAAGADRPGFPVVRHAGHGAADGGLYDLCHPALYQGAVSAKKRYAKRTVFSRK